MSGPVDDSLHFALEASREIAWPELSLARSAFVDPEREGGVVLEVGMPLPPPVDPSSTLPRLTVIADRAALVAARSSDWAVQGHPHALPIASGSVAGAIVSLTFLARADESSALREISRVVAPGGPVVVTALLRGTFVELADLLVEAAEQEDLPGLRGAVLDGREEDPDLDLLERRTLDAGFRVHQCGHVELLLSYPDGAAVVQDPFVRAAVLPMLLPERESILLPPAVLSRLARAVDTYFDGQPFTLTVHVGVLRAEVPAVETNEPHAP